MVNVDGASTQCLAHGVGEDLHVASQHHQLCVHTRDDLELLRLNALLGLSGHRNVVKGNVVGRGQLVKVRVVADDGSHIKGQQAAFDAKEQIVQAVTFLAHHDDAWHFDGALVQRPRELHVLAPRREVGLELNVREACGEFHAHEKKPSVGVVVLSRFRDVATTLEQETRDRVYDARFVGARKVQNV